MRRWMFAAAAAFTTLAQAEPVKSTVDLGRPGALDAIEAKDPQRYARIVEILRIAGDVSCETLPRILKVKHGVQGVRCAGAAVLTSYPAKRHVSFRLEDTAYVVNVVLRGEPATLQPATEGPLAPARPR